MNLEISSDARSKQGRGTKERARGKGAFWKEGHTKADRKKYFFFQFISEGEYVPNGSEGCLASQTGCILESAGGRAAAAGLSCITLGTEGAWNQAALAKY